MKRTREDRIAKLTVGYIRTSVNEQVVMNQKLEILEYCRTHNLKLDKWIESENLHKSPSQRERKGLPTLLPEGAILVTTEISKLGKSTSETVGLIDQLLKNKVRVIFTKQNFDLNLTTENETIAKRSLAIFSMLAHLEKDIISLRTREALFHKKKRGFNIGKVKGTVQRSIYDPRKEQILFLLSKGISVFDTSKIIGIGKPRSLLVYLNKRKLRTERKTKK